MSRRTGSASTGAATFCDVVAGATKVAADANNRVNHGIRWRRVTKRDVPFVVFSLANEGSIAAYKIDYC